MKVLLCLSVFISSWYLCASLDDLVEEGNQKKDDCEYNDPIPCATNYTKEGVRHSYAANSLRKCVKVEDLMCGVGKSVYVILTSCQTQCEHGTPCKKECGTVAPKQVCGSDKKTYENDCLLNNAICDNKNITKLADGECEKPKPVCITACNRSLRPVCGSDGKTYSNSCVLKSTACQNPALNLTIAKNGRCKPKCRKRCNRRCPRNYSPVCGSDGKTYSNRCVFNIAKCKNPRLRLKNHGRCCNRRCARNYSPVCGSDGKTYSNKCVFNIAKCKNPRLRLKNRGKCCDKPCNKRYSPVCGSDGKTYSNKCTFNIAKCKNKKLKLANNGVCKPVYDYEYYDYEPQGSYSYEWVFY